LLTIDFLTGTVAFFSAFLAVALADDLVTFLAVGLAAPFTPAFATFLSLAFTGFFVVELFLILGFSFLFT
jgi:hypothetical protein